MRAEDMCGPIITFLNQLRALRLGGTSHEGKIEIIDDADATTTSPGYCIIGVPTSGSSRSARDSRRFKLIFDGYFILQVWSDPDQPLTQREIAETTQPAVTTSLFIAESLVGMVSAFTELRLFRLTIASMDDALIELHLTHELCGGHLLAIITVAQNYGGSAIESFYSYLLRIALPQ